MKLTKEFNSRLMALKTSGKKAQYTQACMVLTELGTGVDVSKNFRSDSRIPDCLKYELPDGYRIVFQKIASGDDYLALFVGTHSDVDNYLDSHRGWLFDPVRHTLKELRYNTATEDVNNIVRSPELQSQAQQATAAVIHAFEGLTSAQLERAGVPQELMDTAISLLDPDSVEAMLFLGQLPQAPSDLLLSYMTGSCMEKAEIDAFLRGERSQTETLGPEHLKAIEAESDLYVDLADLPSEKVAFEELTFEDWMLYLHPGQKALVTREFNGPARLRGVSGSGKTVVAVHRARQAARRNIRNHSTGKVLFITFNRSLSDLVDRLLMRLCTPAEYAQVEVATHGRWCLDYLKFRTGGSMAWNDATRERVWKNIVAKYLPKLHQANFCLQISTKEGISTRDPDVQFISDEIDFIYGKFLHSEAPKYMDIERTGRGRPLGPNQRTLILSIYNDLVEGLAKEKHFDAREMPRAAYQLLKNGEASQASYTDILVDEVQDLTDMELKVLQAIEQLSGQLFLVGDGAQQIYRRGQSLKSVGINVAGRGFILRKNYRNTAEITEAAARLRASQGIGRFDEDAAASQTIAIPSAVSGEKPCVLVCDTPEQERQLIIKEIRYLTGRLAIQPSQICCLARSVGTRTALLGSLVKSGIKARDYRADEGIAEGDSVLVSTLHNSKGHEFRAVFILGLTEGSIPYVTSQEPEEMEREAALFYVAMTRAKELLYLSYACKTANDKKSYPSRFLADLGDAVETLDFVKSQR